MGTDRRAISLFPLWGTLGVTCVLRVDGLLYDGCEHLGTIHRKISKDLSVQRDLLLLERVHELRIRRTIGTGGSIDTHDPQAAERTLLVAAIAIGVLEALFYVVLDDGPYFGPCAPIAFG